MASKRRYEDLACFVPFEDREVLETYERTSEDAVNIIITGAERGRVWDVSEGTDEWASCKAEYNVEGLIGAIIRGVVDEYREGLKAELKELRDVLARLEGYRKSSLKWEQYLGSSEFISAYGIDPEFVIRETRRMVCEDIHASQKKRGYRRPE